MPKFVPVNKNFFKKWTSEMAYVLGFFTADGCLTINPRGSHYIEFDCNDIDVIKKIKDSMMSGHKISKRISNSNRQGVYRLQIGSKEMYNDLNRFGFTVNKSKVVELPKIPDKYFRDFLRGYFDGDGCVSYTNYFRKQRNKYYKYIIVQFTSGSIKLLEKIRTKIEKLFNIKTCKVICSRNARCYRLNYLHAKAIGIIKEIYFKPKIFMDRKFNISRDAVEFFKK